MSPRECVECGGKLARGARDCTLCDEPVCRACVAACSACGGAVCGTCVNDRCLACVVCARAVCEGCARDWIAAAPSREDEGREEEFECFECTGGAPQ